MICRQCQKKLRPKYREICPDCKVAVHWHRMGEGAPAASAQHGSCQRVFAWTKRGSTGAVKVLNGHGYMGNDYFCTLRCAYDYALKMARRLDKA